MYLPFSNFNNSLPFLQVRSERRRRNHQSDPDEPRHATPPPPFTPTGPSLDGPPFEEVVTLSYPGPPGSQVRPPSLSPVTPPMVLPHPGPPRSHRFSDPSTRTQAPSNPYPSHRLAMPPDNTSRLFPTSAITRVEFDPQMAYANGRNANASIQGGASSFYKQVNLIHHLLSVLKACV